MCVVIVRLAVASGEFGTQGYKGILRNCCLSLGLYCAQMPSSYPVLPAGSLYVFFSSPYAHLYLHL
jgi:hypothetical protein